jgi:hypothetical protein
VRPEQLNVKLAVGATFAGAGVATEYHCAVGASHQSADENE